MARALRKAFPGAKYHVTCRGNGGGRMFYAPADYAKMEAQLERALECERVLLYAYVLMPNHYHLLVETPQANITAFMQRLNTAYAMYFRHKHRRPGHCFQGRYGAKLVEGDEYLLRLTRYIHLNPVKTRAFANRSADERRAFLKRYAWSSYRSYISAVSRPDFVDYRWLELMRQGTPAANARAYRRYVEGCLATDDEWMRAACAKSLYAIGDDDHVEQIETMIREERQRVARKQDIHWPGAHNLQITDVLALTARHYGVAMESLRRHGRSAGEAKSVAIEMACRVCGLSQRAVAQVLGVSEHAVGKQRRRLARRLIEDADLRLRLDQIAKRCRVNV